MAVEHARPRFAVRLRFRRPARRPRLALAGAAALLLVVGVWGTGFRHGPLDASLTEPAAASAGGERALRAEDRRLETALRRLAPRGPYIVIDGTNNRLLLRRDGEVVLVATCSSGSGMVLQEGPGGRRWVFDTPRGVFRVQTRLTDPIWRKPDWAFVEEGQPIPRDVAERFEAGVLGEYALYFGDGYLIHGTLYERLLGRSVTHGCIRLGRDDLRKVYEASRVGTPVFIY